MGDDTQSANRPDFSSFAVKVKDYKCFKGEPQGFERILPINVVVGPNNSGKTALLDGIDYLCRISRSHGTSRRATSTIVNPLGTGGAIRVERVVGSLPLDEPYPDKLGTVGKHEFYLENRPKKLSEIRDLVVSMDFGDKGAIYDGKRNGGWLGPGVSGVSGEARLRWSMLFDVPSMMLRLSAERDLVPENPSNSPSFTTDSVGDKKARKGGGITSCYYRIQHVQGQPRKLVDEVILDGLNQIMGPDASFRAIRVQDLGNSDNEWELFLDEVGKGNPIPVTDCGSGLKTVLLVLGYLHLLPFIVGDGKASDFFFVFEELENNLHPSLQRRLFRYIDEYARKEKTHIFLATHSSVPIDLFSGKDHAQIVRVNRAAGDRGATVEEIATFLGKKTTMELLGVRPSDLLQANCLVWVEGPSDAIYFRKWIELWTRGALSETVHYQCVFSGGTLLTHLSVEGEWEDAKKDLIHVLTINSNVIFLMDSDRDVAGEELKPRVARIEKEVNDHEGFAWITAGREVENYIPPAVLEEVFPGKGLKDSGPHKKSCEILCEAKMKDHKVEFARKVCEKMTLDALKGHMDLGKRMVEVVGKICRWNEMDPEPVLNPALDQDIIPR